MIHQIQKTSFLVMFLIVLFGIPRVAWTQTSSLTANIIGCFVEMDESIPHYDTTQAADQILTWKKNKIEEIKKSGISDSDILSQKTNLEMAATGARYNLINNLFMVIIENRPVADIAKVLIFLHNAPQNVPYDITASDDTKGSIISFTLPFKTWQKSLRTLETPVGEVEAFDCNIKVVFKDGASAAHVGRFNALFGE